MLELSVIGNLGANAELKNFNGSEFISFRVAHTEKFTVNGETRERTIWVDCTQNGNGGNLFRYLVAGMKVYVTGRPDFRIYDSAKYHAKMVGVSLYVTKIELCGTADQVPRQLLQADGTPVTVNKHYHVPVESAWGTVLHSKNLIEYVCDDNGFLSPRDATTNDDTASE